MDKKQLRKFYLDKETNLSVDQVDNLSIKIANQLLKVNLWDRNTFHIFLPIVKKNEINTEYVLHILMGKNKDILVSRSNFENNSMEHVLLSDSTKLQTNKYGIQEPIGGITVNPEQIDVVFVPLLAYDLSGNRLGYGKGFYDRFLRECQSNCIFVGLFLF